MKYKVGPQTGKQWATVILMAIAMLALLLWVVPEMMGVLSEEAEDTFSEWVWDLPAWAIGIISFLFVIAGALFIWAAGHFWEGYGRRRRHERRTLDR